MFKTTSFILFLLSILLPSRSVLLADEPPAEKFAAAGLAVPFISQPTANAQSSPAINYVQGNYATPQSSPSSVSVPFQGAQSAGDMNVVVVGWNNSTAVVQSVIDSRGTSYGLAVGPTVVSGALSQSIYYASNIAAASAGANTVTVIFSTAAFAPDIRIVEYAGASQSNPVDVTAAKSGKGTSSSSGAVTTTNASDLLVGANIVTSLTSGAGSGYTLRISTSPDGDIVEDQMVTTTGSHSATASISSGKWIMQMVAFRAASAVAAPPLPPSNLAASVSSTSQINLAWTASTGGVTNYVIAQCAGAGCTNFSQIATATACTYAVTGLAPATNYSYVVWAVGPGGISGNSNVASATTPSQVSPPTTPANLAATATSSSQIGLAWAASTSASGIADYIVQRAQGGGSFVQVGTSAGTSYNDSGLTAGTSYSYRVEAVDNAGSTSAFSNVASATTQAAVTLSITPANVNFEDVALDSSGTEAATLSNPGASSITVSAADIAGSEFSISGLSLPLVLAAGQSANFNIVFTSTSSGTVTGSVSFVSNASNSPTGESLSGTGVHAVDLTWDASTSSVAGYYVYRGNVSGGPYSLVSASLVTATAYSDMSVTAGQTYYYVVAAVDSSSQQSAYSNEAAAAVPTP
jgi:fibronectin type 3 domain-containing protein